MISIKDAILTVDLPGEGRAGDVAEVGYSVEFFDMTGNTVAGATVPASRLRSPTTPSYVPAPWVRDYRYSAPMISLPSSRSGVVLRGAWERMGALRQRFPFTA